MRVKNSLFAPLVIAAALLTGCGGGGASAGVVPGSSDAGNSQTSTPSATAGDAHFTISDPYRTTQTAARRAQYFSPSTVAIQITANRKKTKLSLSPNSPNCKIDSGTISCAVDLAVDNGPLTYSVQTLDPNSDVLSEASGIATIAGTTTIPLALQGVWKTVTVQLANEHPRMGSPVTIALKVSAYDAGGALIIGPEPYTTPIVLHNSDTSGATTLSKTTLTYPCECATLTYDGKSYVNATVVPTNPTTGMQGQGDVLVPALNITEYAIPSGSVAATNGGNSRMFVNADKSITFNEQNMHLGRVTMGGVVTETTLQHVYVDFAQTPDGTLYGVTNDNTLDRINGDGLATQIAQLPVGGNLRVGGDGNLWSASATNLGPSVTRITPTGGLKTFVVNGPDSIGDGVAGRDGNMWYAARKNGVGEFVRLTPDGQVTEFPIPNAGQPLADVALGPDGEVYSVQIMQSVERISTAGVISSLPAAHLSWLDFYNESMPNVLAFGPDGALWISGAVAGNTACDPVVERVTPSGGDAVLELPIPCDSFGSPLEPITGFVSGPDGNLWYARDKYVGKLVLP